MADPVFVVPGGGASPLPPLPSVSSVVEALASAQQAASFLPPELDTPEVTDAVSSLLSDKGDPSVQLRNLLTRSIGAGATALCVGEIGPLGTVCNVASTFVANKLLDLVGFGTGPSPLAEATAEAQADDQAAGDAYGAAEQALAARKEAVLSQVLPMAGGIQESEDEIRALVDSFYEIKKYGFPPATGKDTRPVWWPDPVGEPLVYPAAYGYRLPFFILGESWQAPGLPAGCQPPAAFVAAISANPVNWRRLYVEEIAQLYKQAGIDVDVQIDLIFTGHPNPDTSDGLVHQEDENGNVVVYTWRATLGLLADIQKKMYPTLDRAFQTRLSAILTAVAVRTKAQVVTAEEELYAQLVTRSGCTTDACKAQLRSAAGSYAKAIAGGESAGTVAQEINKSLGLDAQGNPLPVDFSAVTLPLVSIDPFAGAQVPAAPPAPSLARRLARGAVTLAGLALAGGAVARAAEGKPVLPSDWRHPLGR